MEGRTTILFLLALATTLVDAHRLGAAKAHRRHIHHRHQRRLQFARAPAPAPASGPGAALPPKEKACADLCKDDEGFEKNTCLTECAVATDDRVPEGTYDEALEEFVHDKVHNEQVDQEKDGTPKMAETFEKMTGKDAARFKCLPTVDASDVTFADLDQNGDGKITKVEAYAFGEKMCEPNERVNDLFNMADRDADGVVSKEEFEDRGENQVVEHEVDQTLDKLSPGEDEYAECSLPPFEKFDKDHDGFLHEWELAEAYMFELDRRAGFGVDTITNGTKKEKLSKMKDEIMKDLPAQFKKVDTDGDGKISKEEWDKKAEHKEDMGDQLEEQGEQDEDDDVSDIDDLASVEHDAAPAPAPAFLQRRAVSREAHRAALGSLCQLWSQSL